MNPWTFWSVIALNVGCVLMNICVFVYTDSSLSLLGLLNAFCVLAFFVIFKPTFSHRN